MYCEHLYGALDQMTIRNTTIASSIQDDDNYCYSEARFSSLTFLSNLLPKVDISRIFSHPWSIKEIRQSEVRMTEWRTTAEKQVRAFIVGYEILYQKDMHVVFKIRVEDISPWSIDTLPVWHIFRRYTDFVTLYKTLRMAFPLAKLAIPPKRWLGNRFDPVFLGRRMAKLQDFIVQVLEDDGEIRDFPAVRDFFCFDNPPNRNVSINADRALYDSLEEVIKELREQLRVKEVLELSNNNNKELLREQEIEMDVLRTEVESLRKQKDGLLRALQEDDNLQHHETSSLTIPAPRLLKPASHHGSRLSLVSHGSAAPTRQDH